VTQVLCAKEHNLPLYLQNINHQPTFTRASEINICMMDDRIFLILGNQLTYSYFYWCHFIQIIYEEER